MPTVTITVSTAAAAEIAATPRFSYPKEDGTDPSNAEILERVKKFMIEAVRNEVRNHKQSVAASAISVEDYT